VQAGVSHLDTNRTQMSALVTSSQSATGAAAGNPGWQSARPLRPSLSRNSGGEISSVGLQSDELLPAWLPAARQGADWLDVTRRRHLGYGLVSRLPTTPACTFERVLRRPDRVAKRAWRLI